MDLTPSSDKGSAPTLSESPRALGLLLVLFIGSGCAALIYEVVWFQLLEMVIGLSAVSMGVLLGTFMAGMCLGSALLPRYLGPDWHPLRLYACLELGIALFALVLLAAMPIVGGIYTAWAGTGIAGLLVRGLAAAICLLPPTVLMGATLPAIARWVESTPKGVSWLGFFYGGNIAGAVAGSLLAGFYLLRVHDASIATFVAVALNVGVALAALALASRSAHAPAIPARTEIAVERWPVYVAIGLSGLTALSCQVLWTRTLSLMFGATTYSFSLILAVFLTGLGIGSTAGAVVARESINARVALAWCQILLCAAMAWTSYILTESLPYWPVNPSIVTESWFQFQLDLTRCLYAVLPGAILWGMSFPLALASAASRDQDPARLVGGVYAANTLGAILGAVGASLILVVTLGTQRTQQLMIVISALSALLLLWKERASPPAFASATVAAVLLTLSVNPLPGLLVAYGRYTVFQVGQVDVIYMGEGWNASVAVSERPNGVRNYHNAGKVQASSEPQDMRLQRMLGHLTTLVPDNPRRVLVIGCGAGVTAGAVSIDPAVEQTTIAEIEPLVPRVVSTYFAEHNFDVVNNPRVQLHIDDARHFLQTSDETYDAITSDPLDPWVKGAAMLYTREFFELAKSRLNPGGVMTLFVQLYESNTEAVKSEIGTFFEVFPRGMIFANTYNGEGYDLVLLGQRDPKPIDVEAIQRRLQRPEYQAILRSLEQIEMYSALDLFATYAGEASDFAPWLVDAEINRDRNLRLQYLAGRGLNRYEANVIFSEMRTYSRAPDGVFTGSSELLDRLLTDIQAFQEQ
ncbi:MAG: fused MFS/spermidine synthase [Vicinamibacterales bacterium]